MPLLLPCDFPFGTCLIFVASAMKIKLRLGRQLLDNVGAINFILDIGVREIIFHYLS
jgi:hypothetical protein